MPDVKTLLKDPSFQKKRARYISQKTKDSTPEFKTNFMAWMDRLMRPAYASAGLAQELVAPGEKFEPGREIWKGLTGEDKTLYSDVLETVGWRPTTKIGKFARGVTGFGLDVLLDPLTYVGVGTITKGGRLASRAGKLAPTIAKQAKLGQRALISFMGKPVIKGAPVLKGLGKAGMAARAVPAVEKLGTAFVPGFRPRGVNPNTWNKLIKIKRSATAIRRIGDEKSLHFATGILDDLKKLIKSGQMNESGVKALTESIERRSLVAGLPDSVKPIWNKLVNYADDIASRRKGLGKFLMDDADYNYWLHTLSDAERAKLRRTGMDIGLRDWTTHSASDIQRKYLKFRDLTTGQIHIGKARDIKALPMTFKGISKEHLGNMFETVIKDLSDLQNVAHQYGIKIKFTPKTTTIGRNLGVWQEAKNTLRVATGGQPSEQWISTVAHELAHMVHGKVGAFATLGTPAAIGQSASTILPKGLWRNISDDITKMTIQQKERFYKIFSQYDIGWTPEQLLASVKKKPEYYHKPTEIWARFIELVKSNPSVARKEFPDLHNLLVKVERTFPAARKIFRRETLPSQLIKSKNIYRTTKGQLFEVSQATIGEVNKSLGREFFSTDVPFTAYRMGRRLSRQEAGTHFFNSVRELGSTEAIEGWVKSTTPELKGLHFNPQIAKEIDNLRRVYIGDEVSQGFLKTFDTVQNFWKKWTLGPFPAYHFRNMIGNTWNNYLAGVSPHHMVEAAQIQLKHARRKPLTAWEAKLLERAQALGVLERGWFKTVLGSEAPPTMTRRAGQWAVKPAEAGLKVGRQIENNARLAHFIDKIRKGWSYDEAALSVKKYLFDYSELTPFEINVMRRVMPFYTWSRKNIPLQIEHIIKKPGKTIAPVEKARRELAGGEEPERQFLPEWLQERYPFRVGKPEGGVARYFPLESWLPIADVGKLARPMQAATELTTPAIKLPTELLMNRSFYFEQPIRKYLGQRKEFLGLQIPAKTEYALRNIRLLNELNRLFAKPKPTGMEATKIDKAVRALTGIKTYPQRISEMKRWADYNIDKQIFELKKGYNRAKRNNNHKEAARIKKVIAILEKKK